MKRPIESRKILAVEGKDEYEFFDALFKHMNIVDVRIEEVGGKDQFKDKLPALVRSSGFSVNVEKFAVVRDADQNANSAFRSIRNILKKEGLEPPNDKNQFSRKNPNVGIYIMPGNSSKGMLEDLCLSTVQNTPAIACVDIFVECCKENLNEPPLNPSKAKVQAYLAAMPKVVNRLGIGAQRGYWNFNCQELDQVKLFLLHFS
jgi:hypothetical protein